MAVLTKSWAFEAAHQLIGHKGKCARLHGHSYRLEVTIVGPIKPVGRPYISGLSESGMDVGVHALAHNRAAREAETDDGMVADYDDLSQVVKPLIDQYLDHHFLNDLPGLSRSTAELVACWIYGAIYQKFGNSLVSVLVSETNNTTATVNHYDWLSVGRPGLNAVASDSATEPVAV